MNAVIEVFVVFLVATNASIIKQRLHFEEFVNGNINDDQHADIFQQYHDDSEYTPHEVDVPLEEHKRVPSISCRFPFPKKSNASIYYGEGLIIDIMNEGKLLSAETIYLLELQYLEDNEDQLHEVHEILENIEEHKLHVQCLKCAIVEALRVKTVVKDLYSDIKHCGIAAANESVQIVKDVKDATFQIIFDGYDCLKLYKECEAMTNSTAKRLCKARFSAKFSLYVIKSCRSINTIRGVKKRTLAILPNAVACTIRSTENAVTELKGIRNKINDCLGNN